MTSSSPDPTADGLEAFFEDHASWTRTSRSLQRIARAVVGDEAEDIVQSAWVEALERRQGGLGFGRLRLLVQSRSIDVLRRRAHEPRPGGPRAAEKMPQDDDALGATLEVQREVLEAVDSLDEPYRTTVYLRYFEALEPKAIAKLQEIPEKTIKTRLTRAHQQLRERLRTRFRKKNGRWAPALLGFAGLPSPEASSTLALAASTLLMKKITLATLAVLALAASWIVLRSSREESTSLPAPSVAATTASREEERSALQTVASDDAELGREAVASEPIQSMELLGAVLDRGSLRVRVLRANAAPAHGVHVIATVERGSFYLQQRFRSQTDPDGIAFFPELPLGPISLETDRRASVLEGIEIHPDETSETTMSLAEGLRVVGQVKDANNRPVADAGIWLTNASGGWTAGGIVARSDASGRYEIEDVPEGQSIGAVAAGFQASSLFDLDLIDTSASPVTIDIALAHGGARLSGIVRDTAGSPIENALIVIGDNRRSSNMRMDHSSAESWSPRTAESDAEGRYSMAGLPIGKLPVQARSFDHALWNDFVELGAGLSQVLDITLSKGTVVHGTVTLRKGRAFHERPCWPSISRCVKSSCKAGRSTMTARS